ncbi:uncharacterized protein LOC134705743 [Mytilus trossulus]|uniref:uncharacterized protein LOC134705743 n=1 Tax=Mytilus trossulus TaxID=6551 RepID=UPI0030064BA8
MTIANETDCDMPCHGNRTQICGGIYRLSVYEIFYEKITTSPHPLTSLADTTTDLKRSTRMDLTLPMTSPADTTTDLMRSTQTDLSSVKSSYADQGNSAYSSSRSSVSASAEWTSVESFSSKTSTTDTWTQVSTDSTSNSECVCPCEYVSVVNKTKDELIAIATKDLYIDKTQTSKYKNSKISAEDYRSSSRNIGIVGVLVISITMSLLVLVDCINGPFQQMWVCVTKHKKNTTITHENTIHH